MSTGHLTISLSAIVENWRTLSAMSETETGACVKADGYGLHAASVGLALARAGCRTFFVAVADEGVALRAVLGPEPRIFVFSGHMAGDTQAILDAELIPLLNSVDQMLRHVEAMPSGRFGIQLDTGMNRLGMEPAEGEAVRDIAVAQRPELLMSHLACADEPYHPMNAKQMEAVRAMTAGLDIPRALAATGGILLGRDYHFDLTRPGIGLYGGLPFAEASPVVSLSLPIIQVRDVAKGESVGYGNTWVAQRPSRVATVSGGYADGIIRAVGPKARIYAGDVLCPVVGRVSMDLITVDVTDLPEVPDALDLLGPHQGVDAVADMAGTIGYEILTSLGARYTRDHVE